MKIHIPAFQAMARCNEYMNHGPIDIDLGSDVVPVVRCRECKSYDHGCCVVKRYRGDDSIITMPPDSYCSYGQRREDDHEVS